MEAPARGRLSGSLAFRMVVSAAAFSAVALMAAGLVLTELYRAAQERGFDARLAVYQKAIVGQVGAAAPEDLPEFGELGEPRFLLPLTGWYWTVRDREGATLATSRSLVGDDLDLPPAAADGTVSAAYGRGPGGEAVRLVLQTVDFGDGRAFQVAVTGSADELEADIAGFRLRVFITLAVFALGLVAATVGQVRFALAPLEEMRRALTAIREGRARRLEGTLPREIAPLAAELNALIATNHAIVERSRAHVGNLAHGLKTPLSVLLNEGRAAGGPLGAKVVEQGEAMRDLVQRYLDRARAAAERQVVGASAEVRRSVELIARVIARAYPQKDLAIDVEGPADLSARIDRRDLEELVGNLMDNAAKYGQGRILVEIAAGAEPVDGLPMLAIAVSDDGPGLPEAAHAAALGRGRRLDESKPGSGLGLAIAGEIVEACGGRIVLSRAAMGGLKVTVVLPVSRPA